MTKRTALEYWPAKHVVAGIMPRPVLFVDPGGHAYPAKLCKGKMEVMDRLAKKSIKK